MITKFKFLSLFKPNHKRNPFNDKMLDECSSLHLVKKVSKLRQYFRFIIFKLTGGLSNISLYLYNTIGIAASDSSYGVPKLLLNLFNSFKQVSNITIYLSDNYKFTRYVSAYKDSNNISTVDYTNNLEIDRNIINFVQSNGFNIGGYATLKNNKLYCRSFNMELGDFNIYKRRFKIQTDHKGKLEKIILPIMSSDSNNIIGLLEIKGNDLRLKNKLFRSGTFIYVANVSRLLYGIISRQLDHLTRLLNRQAFMTSLFRICKKFLENQDENISNISNLSLIMIDIDKFKDFNDTYGHQQGDNVLKLVAKTIRKNIRSRDDQIDLAGRFGGEEFILLIPNQGDSVAGMIADRLRNSVASKRMPDLNNVSVNISTGVVDALTAYKLLIGWRESKLDSTSRSLLDKFFNKNPEILDEPQHKQLAKLMIYLSDNALYVSKQNGRNETNVLKSSNEGMYYNTLKD